MKVFKKLISITSAIALTLSICVPALASDGMATVNASCGEGGSISPKYNVEVPEGEDLTFKITPDEGYEIKSVTVDGLDKEDISSYTFYNIFGDHIIRAEFKKITKKYTQEEESTGYTKLVGQKVEPEKETANSAWTTDPNATAERNEANKDKTFYIKASAGTGGKISPSNTVSAKGGESVTFEMLPKDGYVVKGVYIDDIYGGKPTTYTFSNLAKDHTIRVEFESAANAEIGEMTSNNSNKTVESIDIGYSISGVENPYRDVTSKDSYYKSVLNLYNNDVLLGTSANEFSPNEYLTRQDAARAFYRIERIASSNFSNPYTDVSESSSYRDAIAWSYHNGIIEPQSDGIFNPTGAITKEELCQMIYNYAKYTGAAPTGSWAIKLPYTDTNELSSDKIEGVMYCTLKSIVTKNSNGTLAPKSYVTRAEAAEILNNAMIVTRRDSGKQQ